MSTVEPALNSLSVAFVEQMYADYLRDAESVSPDWRNYFDELSHGSTGNGSPASNGHGEQGNGAAGASSFRVEPTFRPSGLFGRPPVVDDNEVATAPAEPRQPRARRRSGPPTRLPRPTRTVSRRCTTW